LAPRASNQNGRPQQKLTVKKSQSFIEFAIIGANELRTGERRKTIFYVLIFLPLALCCPGLPHHSPPLGTPLRPKEVH
jgi:hypothetical protein